MKPLLKFNLNYKKDISAFFSFLKDAQFDNGRSLDWAIFTPYPFFKKYQNETTIKIPKKQLELFVKEIYKKNKKLATKNINEYKKDWEKTNNKFYTLVDTLFNKHPWPLGKYTAYLTIWGMFPRFLEDKTFLLPYKYKNKKYINVIIAHEMLHFIFYDYFYKKYPKFNYGKYNFFVWNVSEIFNSVIQNSPEWLKVFKEKTMDYPEHEKIIKSLSKKYYKREKFNIDVLSRDIITELVNAKK